MALAIDSGVELIFTFGAHTQGMVTDDESLWMGHFESKEKLIAQLLDEIKPGDAVLVKGSRGMKMEDVVDAVKAQFS